MHEMALAQSILELALETAASRGCARLTRLVVHCGQISGVMPEALDLAFECLVKGTPHEGAKLDITILPLKLKCPFCGTRFGASDQGAIYTPCPNCGEEFGHIVEQGKEMLVARIEAQA